MSQENVDLMRSILAAHAKGAALCHVHGSKVTKMVLYYDRECAFADLGVSE